MYLRLHNDTAYYIGELLANAANAHYKREKNERGDGFTVRYNFASVFLLYDILSLTYDIKSAPFNGFLQQLNSKISAKYQGVYSKSFETIAQLLGLKRRRIIDIISELCAFDFISKNTKTGGKFTNFYSITQNLLNQLNDSNLVGYKGDNSHFLYIDNSLNTAIEHRIIANKIKGAAHSELSIKSDVDGEKVGTVKYKYFELAKQCAISPQTLKNILTEKNTKKNLLSLSNGRIKPEKTDKGEFSFAVILDKEKAHTPQNTANQTANDNSELKKCISAQVANSNLHSDNIISKYAEWLNACAKMAQKCGLSVDINAVQTGSAYDYMQLFAAAILRKNKENKHALRVLECLKSKKPLM